MEPVGWEALCGCGVGVEVEAFVFKFNLNEEVFILRDGVEGVAPHF